MTQQELKNKIKDLEKQIEELKILSHWKPEKGDEYYFVVDNDGSVYSNYWHNDNWDKWRYLIGNCFQTEEQAEEYKKKLEYTARYKNYIEEHSEPIDWNDFNAKYFLIYDYKNLQIESMFSVAYKVQNTICASSEKILFEAINEIGEDNFKKYVLGVK